MVQNKEEKNFLNKLYVKHAIEYRRKLELEENDPEFQELVEQYEQGIVSADIYAVIDQAYLSTRAVHFNHKPVRNFEAVISEASKHVETVYSDGAYYRVPKNRGRMKWDRNDPTEAVISLNVVQDKRLIKKLDEFTTRHKCFYATVESNEWNETLAPIQIYFKEPLNTSTPANQEKYQQISVELSNIVSSSIRDANPQKTEIPFSDQISYGIYKEKTVPQPDLDYAMDHLKKELPPHIFEGIQDFIVEKSSKQGNKINLVQYKAVEHVAQVYVKQYLSNAQINIRDEKLYEKPQEEPVKEVKKEPVAAVQEPVIINKEPLKELQAVPATESEKRIYSAVCEKIAKQDNAQYQENTKSEVFKAEITKPNGEVLNVAANKSNISITARNKTGKRIIPDYKYFEGIAEIVAQKGRGLNLATLKRPEVKARAYIACMRHKPPVKMINTPVLDKKFLNLITPQTRAKLQPFIFVKEKESDLKTIVFGKNFEKVTPVAKKGDTKSSFISQANSKSSETNANAASTEVKNPTVIPLKPVETTKPNGDYAYTQPRKTASAWELKIELPLETPAKPVSQYLKTLRVSHAIAKDERNNTRTITAYISSKEDITKLSEGIQKNFPKQVKKMSFSDGFVTRAWSPRSQELQPIFTSRKTESSKVIAPIRLRIPSAKTEEFLVDAGIEKGILNERTIAPISENKDSKIRDKALLLEAYASHRIYSKYGKENYYGKDRLGFERRIFGKSLLPKLNSPERKKWDLVANQYEVFLQTHVPERLQLMGKVVSYKEPVDFKLFTPQNQEFIKPEIRLMRA